MHLYSQLPHLWDLSGSPLTPWLLSWFAQPSVRACFPAVMSAGCGTWTPRGHCCPYVCWRGKPLPRLYLCGGGGPRASPRCLCPRAGGIHQKASMAPAERLPLVQSPWSQTGNCPPASSLRSGLLPPFGTPNKVIMFAVHRSCPPGIAGMRSTWKDYVVSNSIACMENSSHKTVPWITKSTLYNKSSFCIK